MGNYTSINRYVCVYIWRKMETTIHKYISIYLYPHKAYTDLRLIACSKLEAAEEQREQSTILSNTYKLGTWYRSLARRG